MPKSSLHDRKRTKNYAVMGAVLAFIVLVFVVTILKMS